MKRISSHHLLIGALVFISLTLTGCEWFGLSKKQSSDTNPNQKVIARVQNNSLYADDIENLIHQASGMEDSSQTVKRFVRSWINKQLLMKEAKTLVSYDEAKIKQKVLDYQYALMAFEYERNYLNKHLNMKVSQEEVQTYYGANKANFELKQNIVKGFLVKVPRKETRRNLNRFRKWSKSPKVKDLDALMEFSYSNATNYVFELEQWIEYDQLVKSTPFVKVMNKVDFLKRYKETEITEGDFIYFLKIKNYKITNQIAPIQLVEDDIRKIILNKRKIALISALKEQIYKRAVKNNEFEIFENE